MKPRVGSHWMVILAGVSAVCVHACAPSAVPEQEQPRPVRTLRVSSTGAERVRSFSGRAQAGVESYLSFRVPGNVQRVLVETGDLVGAAQLIAELEPTDYQLRVQEAEAALLQAEAQARNADASYARVRGLYENRNASRQDLDAARAQAESAQAQIDAARQRLEQARAQLSYTRLRAPVDGSIASVLIETSENVTAGQRIAMLTAGTRPQVEVAVPESLIADVERGERVQVTFDALPGQDFEGSVTEVGVAATGLATTFPVTVALIEEAEAVRSGMAANVSFTFGAPDASERFLLPPHSVLEDRQGRFVFVAVPTDTDAGLATVERRGVRVGDLTGDGLEVLSGIVDEDLVITAGVSQVQEGLIVRIDSASRETS